MKHVTEATQLQMRRGIYCGSLVIRLDFAVLHENDGDTFLRVARLLGVASCVVNVSSTERRLQVRKVETNTFGVLLDTTKKVIFHHSMFTPKPLKSAPG